MSTGIKLSDRYLKAERQLEVMETFTGGVPGIWTGTTVGAGAAVAALSARGGGISLTTGAIDNDPVTLTLDSKPFDVANAKPLHFKASIQFSEANTNAGNVLVGLHSGAVASALADNGGGPPSSYSGFAFFKVDGETRWQVEASVGSTQDTTDLTAANSANKTVQTAGSSSFQILEIDVIPKTSTKCDVMFSINGSLVKKITDFTYTSIAAMAPVAVVKAGSATAEVLKVRLIQATQVI